MGDAHAAQGDSELDGTAIETSITGRVKVTLHKKASLPKLVQVGPHAGRCSASSWHRYTLYDACLPHHVKPAMAVITSWQQVRWVLACLQSTEPARMHGMGDS